MLKKLFCKLNAHAYRAHGTYLTCENCDKTISAYEGGDYWW